MDRPLISVIVPIYNVEKFIHKCVNSILEQSYPNLEIILVDDGSPDNCGAICDQYEQQYRHVKVVHKSNGGLSDARNAGLEVATGEYIGFVDSDDYIHKDMYNELFHHMTLTNSDIAECAVERIYADKVVAEETGEVTVLSGTQALKSHLSSEGNGYMPRTAVWSKLFSRKIIDRMEGMVFPKGEIHEDYLFTCKALYYSNKVCLVNKCLYHHIYTNPSSITQSSFSSKDLYKELQYMNRMEFLKKLKLQDHFLLAKSSYYKLLLQFFYKCHIAGMKEECLYYKQKIKEHHSDIVRTKIGWKKKLEFIVFSISPNVYLKIRANLN
ncbi:glycosyltransferase [Aureibacillus halotolerans]|uniref:Glycosyl transferase family 2 n=1 Tax=Aureibacillus halotolerans TaxID=1508390 RepID=A0A4R6TV57_9BACI|nr:glycosyltransferase [Aureibacillus halotolerans]TDQ37650.1 glycosyl transferase family 2 [Aureibacillus halotolerans]